MRLNQRKSLGALAVAGTILGLASWAGAQDRTLDPATQAAVDRIFAAYDNDASPGCALVVLDRDRVVYRRGYGMADLEHGIPIGETSVFRTGSVSKQFTAAVMLLLAQDGILSLAEPLRSYLREIPEFGYEITLRHLLSHTSGIRDYLDLMALAGRGSDDFYRKEQALELLARQEGLNFPPGERFLYSNSGYFLLSQVVRAATGRTLRAEAQDRIFGPLGMAHTHFHDDRNELVVNRAAGYAPKEGGGYEISMTKLDLVGDGGVFTTIDDLARWLVAFEHGGFGGPGFFPALLTRGVLNDGTTLDYALGIGHGNHRGLAYVGHGGSFVGFRATTLRFPEQHLSLGLLCNRSDVNPMGMALSVSEEILAGVMEPAPSGSGEEEAGPQGGAGPDPDSGGASGPGVPAEILGTYYSRELDATYELRLEEGRLVLELDGIRTLPVTSVEPGVYRALFITLRIRREGGRVVGLDATLPRASALPFEWVGPT